MFIIDASILLALAATITAISTLVGRSGASRKAP